MSNATQSATPARTSCLLAANLAVLTVCPAALLVEQVMRVCSDDLLVVPFLDIAPLSQEFLSALGRLAVLSPLLPLVGSPLQVWAGTGTLHPEWRLLHVDVPNSVWNELCVLRTLAGSAAVPSESFAEPFSELIALRSQYC